MPHASRMASHSSHPLPVLARTASSPMRRKPGCLSGTSFTPFPLPDAVALLCASLLMGCRQVSIYHCSTQVLNIYVAPMLLEILRDESPVAVLRLILAA